MLIDRVWQGKEKSSECNFSPLSLMRKSKMAAKIANNIDNLISQAANNIHRNKI